MRTMATVLHEKQWWLKKNPSKTTKRVGKQKVKDIEQEEQLKLAKKVINNLERKLGEIENSNKSMTQELNLLKSGVGSGDSDTKTLEQGGAPMPHSGNSGLNGTTPLVNPHSNPNEIQALKEQVRLMEIVLLRSRVYNWRLTPSNRSKYSHGKVIRSYSPQPICTVTLLHWRRTLFVSSAWNGLSYGSTVSLWWLFSAV